MNGIYINGMDKPKVCCDCSFNVGVCVAKVAVFGKERLHEPGEGWCPLVEVPDHGDLIDREELIKKMVNTPIKALEGVDYDQVWFTRVADTASQFIDEVDQQVAIIPVERSKE